MARILDIAILAAALTGATLAGASVAEAADDCSCRAPGRRVELGGTACLPSPAGPRLARCVMVLNNPSWQFLETPCPVSSVPDPGEPRRIAGLAPLAAGARR
ncbi:MAG: hypothetical protein OEL76_02140 [Siculibacillus sp.]|nr:hypothetical protein [Siculibacillus sp.]